MSQFGWIQKLDVSGDRDLLAKKGLVKTFIVEGYDPQKILDEPDKIIATSGPFEGMSLPLYGAPFGGGVGGTATLEQYAVITTNVTTGGAIVTEVEARYSNDKRWRAAVPPINRTSPGIIRDTFQREKLTFLIPWAEKGKIQQSGTQIDIDDWQVKPRTIGHVIYKWVKTVTLQDFNTGMLSLIEAQNDKLHWFLDRWWLFESGDAVPVDDEDGKYEVEYIWASDPGTKDIGFRGDQSPLNIAFPQDRWEFGETGVLARGETYIRPPHHDIVAVFALGHTQVGPVFEPFMAKTLEADGWQTLPGIGG